MRSITIFSTRGEQMKVIQTDVTTWGALKPLITNEGYSLDGLVAMENQRRTNLVLDTAELPSGDFTLFLRPEQTKSGMDPYESSLLSACIKRIEETLNTLRSISLNIENSTDAPKQVESSINPEVERLKKEAESLGLYDNNSSTVEEDDYDNEDEDDDNEDDDY